MTDDVTVVRDEQLAYDDGEIVKVRLLRIPQSDRFPTGVKYAFHYGEAGAEHPIIRFDNHHGPHELHLGARTFEIEFPGFVFLNDCFRAALPPKKREDW
ncbi:toxin-antitoxin system TumE family protein [Natronomonas sp. EA1]|uniref:toxin-antitoxin system TumE family protein n=1 Tax=Natronomonas sp. EA1 TaxID=3421655 RepID=UPI003EB7E15A